jgi:hypothetical protein
LPVGSWCAKAIATVVLNGPEPDGNAAAGAFDEWRYPTGAHYLPLPSSESAHVRALLVEMGVIESGSDSLRPALTNGCWCTLRTSDCGATASGRTGCCRVALAPTKCSSSAFSACQTIAATARH